MQTLMKTYKWETTVYLIRQYSVRSGFNKEFPGVSGDIEALHVDAGIPDAKALAAAAAADRGWSGDENDDSAEDALYIRASRKQNAGTRDQYKSPSSYSDRKFASSRGGIASSTHPQIRTNARQSYSTPRGKSTYRSNAPKTFRPQNATEMAETYGHIRKLVWPDGKLHNLSAEEYVSLLRQIRKLAGWVKVKEDRGVAKALFTDGAQQTKVMDSLEEMAEVASTFGKDVLSNKPNWSNEKAMMVSGPEMEKIIMEDPVGWQLALAAFHAAEPTSTPNDDQDFLPGEEEH